MKKRKKFVKLEKRLRPERTPQEKRRFAIEMKQANKDKKRLQEKEKQQNAERITRRGW